jgi:hypothetical protein
MGFQINRPLVRSLVVEIILLKNEKKKKILALIFLTMFDQYIEFTFSRTRIKVPTEIKRRLDVVVLCFHFIIFPLRICYKFKYSLCTRISNNKFNNVLLVSTCINTYLLTSRY